MSGILDGQPEPVTVVCMVCQGIVSDKGPDAPISHGIGPCCFAAYRAENGLPPRPYPISKSPR